MGFLMDHFLDSSLNTFIFDMVSTFGILIYCINRQLSFLFHLDLNLVSPWESLKSLMPMLGSHSQKLALYLLVYPLLQTELNVVPDSGSELVALLNWDHKND